MAKIRVTSGAAGPGGDGEMTLERAIAQAMSTEEADEIVFARDVTRARLDPMGITAAGGQLTIIGDRDGDGLGDVRLLLRGGGALEVAEGADLTLRGFAIGGPSSRGADGADGDPGDDGSYNPFVFDAIERARLMAGEWGDDGGAAVSAARLINRGRLALEEVTAA